MKKRQTHADVLKEIRVKARERGGTTAMARKSGCSVQFVSDVVLGRRPIADRLAEAMGYRRVVEYERIL